ncbi:helix-turn-helix domain-containing protein [Formosa sediminum]|uniref:Helix-turn-helix domain-containing protein n=1 Tax=Formosa sediminum TaxID=2594004 RepID=A0A516GSW5_9FLAO|nr:response regulator transcription factor [Formosa sediminum]QDO94617.1 helix-turn-helix domain-containing protein [Formosa sediminum]
MSKKIVHINSISEYHKVNNLPSTKHPLVSVINFEDIKHIAGASINVTHSFYCIALKRIYEGKMGYGQQEYDFDNGVLAFVAPNQVMSIEVESANELNHSGWLLIFHPDFLWNTTLASKIKNYDFFEYQLNEALHLSEKEEKILIRIMEDIYQEYNSNIDNFSQNVIISHLDLFLTYSNRFYQRQFITRVKSNHSVIEQFEFILGNFVNDEMLKLYGLPKVEKIAKEMNVSPNYLTRLLKAITGKSTQTFIHEEIMKLAKEKLSTTELSVNEIAYELGFEHPQSFGKLFKKKTKMTPLEFRKSHN